MPLGLFLFFFGGHLPQTSGFRSAKQIFVVSLSFATQARAFILSGRNIFYTPGRGGGTTTVGPDAPGAFTHFFFIISFFGGHLPQTSCFRSAKSIRAANVRSP